MAAIEELSPAAGPVSTRPPEDEIDDDEDEDLDETLMERLWGLTEMFPDTVRTAAEVSAQCSVSLAKKFYRRIRGNGKQELITLFTRFSFSRSALWVGTTSFMILVLPVVFETERLQLEQQQLQQQRQILLGPNTGMSGGMPGMMPPAPGKM
ncbi:Mitochondrial import receptor subunit TOM22-like protein [Nibea albiflora]|uniref:Mitochondrial import receptor subunit TOM22-like protein n=1 Tax=Nibea albiflora TaxID=240163 RepID=A0ACB7F3P7_NIBAL|nr:Mitochondrial import receptor subunit TOM22-like protein [Nibea albiflora]